VLLTLDSEELSALAEEAGARRPISQVSARSSTSGTSRGSRATAGASARAPLVLTGRHGDDRRLRVEFRRRRRGHRLSRPSTALTALLGSAASFSTLGVPSWSSRPQGLHARGVAGSRLMERRTISA
jgi:hypothetical protein